MSKQRWTPERALEVYRKVFPDDQIYQGKGDSREKEIVGEMNAVKTANSLVDAAHEIEWWYVDLKTAIAVAKRIRRFK